MSGRAKRQIERSRARNRRDELASRSETNISFTQNIFNGEHLPLETLDKLSPDVRDWVKSLTEKEQEARHKWAFQEQQNRRDYDHSHLSAIRLLAHSGQFCTTALSLTAIVGGIFLLLNDKGVAGYSAMLGGVALMILAGFFGKSGKAAKAKSEEESQK